MINKIKYEKDSEVLIDLDISANFLKISEWEIDFIKQLYLLLQEDLIGNIRSFCDFYCTSYDLDYFVTLNCDKRDILFSIRDKRLVSVYLKQDNKIINSFENYTLDDYSELNELLLIKKIITPDIKLVFIHTGYYIDWNLINRLVDYNFGDFIDYANPIFQEFDFACVKKENPSFVITKTGRELPLQLEGAGFKCFIWILVGIYLAKVKQNLVLIPHFSDHLHPLLVKQLLDFIKNENILGKILIS